MQKRLIYGAGWIAAFFLCVVCFSMRVQAAPSFSANASASSAKQGDKISVTVTVQGNGGVSSALLMLNYDNKTLKYTGTNWGAGVAATSSDLGSAVQLSMNSSAGYYENGTFAVVNFEAVQNADAFPFSLQIGDLVEIQAAPTTEEESWEDSDDSEWEDDDSEWEDDTVDDTWESSEEETASTTNGWIDDDAWNKQDKTKSNKKSDSNSNATKDNTDNWDTAEADWGGQETATVQPTNATRVSAGNGSTSRASADRTYKTGVGLGDDIFIVLFAITAVAALLVLVRRSKIK